MAETLPDETTMPLADGLWVSTERRGNRLTLRFRLAKGADCLLHWGLSGRGGAWQRPPESWCPEGSQPIDGHAVRTPFVGNKNGEREVVIHLDLPCPRQDLPFVLYFPSENRWLKSGGKDFCLRLARLAGDVRCPEEALTAWAPGPVTAREIYPLDGGERLAAAVCEVPGAKRVCLACDSRGPVSLHWGVAWRFRYEWQLPPEDFRPSGTTVFDASAVQTRFAVRDGLAYLELQFPKAAEGPKPRGLRFVLYQADQNLWLKSGGKDMYLPLFEPEPDPRLANPQLAEWAEQIVSAEKGANSWTLMHRFHLCYDLVDKGPLDEEGLALLFAWLRYSAIRQLDWQRSYNTKPRELSHAQDRLTSRLAGFWRKAESEKIQNDDGRPVASMRTWLRLLFTTLGRGGDGQRVRDEILHIMHRNHLKEVGGHFIEEWHQKLHNNTTPDDIVICQAYLAFLRSHGDRAAFYRALEEGGVPRQRLRSFERPIKTDPEFYADRKDALLKDFENFLGVLKSVHAGTDLDSAAAAARGRLEDGRKQLLDRLLALRQGTPEVRQLAGAITDTREGQQQAMRGAGDDAALRDLLYLDLALEELLRGAIERENLSQQGQDQLVELIHWILRNLYLSVGGKEVEVCAGHWAALRKRPRDSAEWALHAKSVSDRMARWVQGFTSDIYRRLQPKAEFLGAEFGVEAWSVSVFSEEVIRCGPAFALALLLRHLDPVLRKAAGLGGWQVISLGSASGRVRVVDRLIDVQSERFAEPTVLIADAVTGMEEIPEGVTAIITSDTPDLVSHVAVRARNAPVLFATCFEPKEYQRLQGMKDRIIGLGVNAGGDVQHTEEAATRRQGDKETRRQGDGAAALALSMPPKFRGAAPSSWVLTQDQFTPDNVGAKANNLNGLRGRLPEWIHVPASLALPFCVFEKALADEGNKELRRQYQALVATVEQKPADVLARLRQLLLEVTPPAGLQEALRDGWQRVRLPAVPWEQVWAAVRRVWASKWNERAYLSRRARGIAHDALQMAVLIQQVVEADYAYVIHTVNPLTGNRAEIYAEVVLGLGETLVGNYPGRALGFVCRKADMDVRIISYPSKSIGLYGKGVICRSDSNGEDLVGFAGAGLYDSFLAEEPKHRVLDYRCDKLVWDTDFRANLLRTIARAGMEVGQKLGSAQDIEGAVASGRFYVVQTRPQVGLSKP
jgi:alpha-glucan,water dikinase